MCINLVNKIMPWRGNTITTDSINIAALHNALNEKKHILDSIPIFNVYVGNRFSVGIPDFPLFKLILSFTCHISSEMTYIDRLSSVICI